MKIRKLDKILHFIAGIVIAGVGTLFLGAYIGFAAAVMAGAAKEIIDLMGYGTPEISDFVHTLAGAMLGTFGGLAVLALI